MLYSAKPINVHSEMMIFLSGEERKKRKVKNQIEAVHLAVSNIGYEIASYIPLSLSS